MLRFNVRGITCVVPSSDGAHRVGGATGEGYDLFFVHGVITITGDKIALGDIGFARYGAGTLGESPIFNAGDAAFVTEIYSV